MASIGSFPGVSINPYLKLFYSALEGAGIAFWGKVDPWTCSKSGEWPDFIHLHWPERLWQNKPPELVKMVRRLPGGWRCYRSFEQGVAYVQMRRLMKILERARRRGKKVVWTLHNVLPHEGNHFTDRQGYARLCRIADLCIVHSESALAEFECEHGKVLRAVVMPHGNYDGVYPTPRDRSIVLDELGLDPERPTMCCLGSIREYKGFELALEAIALLGGRVQLIIAGRVHPGYEAASLVQRAREVPGVIFLPEFIDDQRFADLTCAADATLLPYKRITGSGVLLASLTLGSGVIASDLPYFREVINGKGEAGLLFPVGDVKELASTIEAYLNVPRETHKRAAADVAANYAWAQVVGPVVRAMQDLLVVERSPVFGTSESKRAPAAERMRS